LSFEARIPKNLNKIAYNLSFEARIPKGLNKIAKMCLVFLNVLFVFLIDLDSCTENFMIR